MSLPFAFEPRPIDAFMPGRREAHDTETCWECGRRVLYGLLMDRDQAEYRISYLCPECFADCAAIADEAGL